MLRGGAKCRFLFANDVGVIYSNRINYKMKEVYYYESIQKNNWFNRKNSAVEAK